MMAASQPLGSRHTPAGGSQTRPDKIKVIADPLGTAHVRVVHGDQARLAGAECCGGSVLQIVDGVEAGAGGVHCAINVGGAVGGGDEECFVLRWRNEDAAAEHFAKECGEALCVGKFRAGVVVDIAGRKEKGEKRAHGVDLPMDAGIAQRDAQALNKAGCIFLKLRVEARDIDLRKRRQAGAHGERIPRESAGLIDGAERRDLLHDVLAPTVSGNGQSPADDLPEYREIRMNMETFLRAAVGYTEAGDDFVEDKKRAITLGDGAQRFQKAMRGRHDAHVCRDGFYDHGRDFSGVLSEDAFDGGGVVIRRVESERGERVRNAGAGRNSKSGEAGTGLGEKTVGVAVVATLEFQDKVASGKAAGQADGGHGRFRAGADEADALDRRDGSGDSFAEFDFER